MNTYTELLMDSLLGFSAEEWLRLAEVIALVVATWVGGRQLRLLRREYKEANVRDRRARALEYSLARNSHMRDARERVELVFPWQKWHGKVIPEEVLQEEFKKHPEVRFHLIVLLANWENLALMIAARIADEQLAEEMVSTTMVEYVHRFQEFINLRHQHEPRIYAYLLHQAKRWSGRRRSPRLHYRA
ncbi:MAG: hypothetical protein KDA80_24085 [Planctomycetaceae bacterium]|nr:hypothetical protein [Planctomycetaceae bacterium]